MRIQNFSCIFFPEVEHREIECEDDFPPERLSYRSRHSIGELTDYYWIHIVSPIHSCTLMLMLVLNILVLYLFMYVPIYCCKMAQEAWREVFVVAFYLKLNEQVYWLISF